MKNDLKKLGATLGLEFEKDDIDLSEKEAIFIKPPLYIKEHSKELHQLMLECDKEVAFELGYPDKLYAPQINELIELKIQNKKEKLIQKFLDLAYLEFIDQLDIKPTNIYMDLIKFNEILLNLRTSCIDKNISIHNENGSMLLTDKYMKINDSLAVMTDENYQDILNEIICTDNNFEWTINTPEPDCYDINLIKQDIENDFSEKAGLLLKVFDLQKDSDYIAVFNKYRKD